ncbi:hypothetical protein [Paenibacillus tyrfis]|uniref:hypothetical protein n=1 Tax=Paenibacillus tyrfis TaxID=1501230 RepID=UPI00209F38DD|nr:hypothetical protein [Paenibacillus tyrfis]MCP1310673.1 hypothetical protein [Paenibacillus tyrfis]
MAVIRSSPSVLKPGDKQTWRRRNVGDRLRSVDYAAPLGVGRASLFYMVSVSRLHIDIDRL